MDNSTLQQEMDYLLETAKVFGSGNVEEGKPYRISETSYIRITGDKKELLRIEDGEEVMITAEPSEIFIHIISIWLYECAIRWAKREMERRKEAKKE